MLNLNYITIYETRTSRVITNLSDDTFNAFNRGSLLEALCGYAIDAPEQIPSGSMRAYGASEKYYFPRIHSREDDSVNNTYRNSVAKRLIAEVLAKLKAEKNETS